MPAAVEASNVGRRYRHGLAEGGPLTWRTLLSETRRRTARHPLWALRNVSFTLDDGRSLGLVGPNGAGKSTLLKLLGGIGLPDEGRLRVKGRVAAMFELGQDFHPDLTGRANIQTAGVIAGFSRREVRRRLPDIVEFAELGGFLDSPLRIYSSGMRARLAFAIAIHAEPEILLIDEVLAVGDLGFQRRCYDRLLELRAAGVTLVVASHSVDEVKGLCDEVIWLRGGRKVVSGPPHLVLDRYAEVTTRETRLLTPRGEREAETPAGIRLELQRNRFGTLEATIDAVRVQDSWGRDCTAVQSGAPLHLEVLASIPVALSPVNLSLKLVRNRDGVLCLNTSTRVSITASTAKFTAEVERLDLAPGDYSFDIGLYSEDWDRTFDFHHGAYELEVTSSCPSDAILAPPIAWKVQDVTPHRVK